MRTWPSLPTWPSKKPLAAMVQLEKTLRKLEKRKNRFTEKAAQEVEKAKEFLRDKTENAALLCLRRKKLYEEQTKQFETFEYWIDEQMTKLEGAKARFETVDALRIGSAAMQKLQKAINNDDVDKTMDEVNKVIENVKQIRESLSTPIVAATDNDEDELEAELKKLEEQLLPAATASAAPEPASSPLCSSGVRLGG